MFVYFVFFPYLGNISTLQQYQPTTILFFFLQRSFPTQTILWFYAGNHTPVTSSHPKSNSFRHIIMQHTISLACSAAVADEPIGLWSSQHAIAIACHMIPTQHQTSEDFWKTLLIGLLSRARFYEISYAKRSLFPPLFYCCLILELSFLPEPTYGLQSKTTI